MNKKELVQLLDDVDDDAEVIIVIYTDDGYEGDYLVRVDKNTRYNCVTGDRLNDDESVVELTNSTGVK